MTTSLNKTRFTEFLVRENSLDKSGFEEWIFYPGMLFNELEKWWGDKKGKRNRRHEGLDLFLYRDQRDRILQLDKKTRVPVMYDGVVVSILSDFLGRSVIVEHGSADNDNRKLCTIYGHTSPYEDIQVGRTVKQGDVIATLADAGKSKAGISTHLHISIGWTFKSISYDRLGWETIGDPDKMTLLDPLNFIDRRYVYKTERYG
jgi:murein DD-endopeptidase MepM/ murein hydrolase activator NlpD